jgi:hypothetical protein
MLGSAFLNWRDLGNYILLLGGIVTKMITMVVVNIQSSLGRFPRNLSGIEGLDKKSTSIVTASSVGNLRSDTFHIHFPSRHFKRLKPAV